MRGCESPLSHILILSSQSETIVKLSSVWGRARTRGQESPTSSSSSSPSPSPSSPPSTSISCSSGAFQEQIFPQLQRHFDLPTRWLEVYFTNLSEHRYRIQYNNTTIQNRLKMCLCETRMKPNFQLCNFCECFSSLPDNLLHSHSYHCGADMYFGTSIH